MTYRIDDLEVPAESPFRHDALDRKPLVEFLSSLCRVAARGTPMKMGKHRPWAVFLAKRPPLERKWVPMKGRV